MKQETAVGPKEVRENQRKFLSMADALTIIGGLSLDFIPKPDTYKQDIKDAIGVLLDSISGRINMRTYRCSRSRR